MPSLQFHSTMNEENLPSSPSNQTYKPINQYHEQITAVDSCPKNLNPSVHNHQRNFEPDYDSSKLVDKKTKKKKIKKKVLKDGSEPEGSCSSLRSSQKGLTCKRRSPRVLIGSHRRSSGALEAMAFSLGMSFAAFVSKVLERQDVANGKISVDQLSVICNSAVRESLVNVFGNKFDGFLEIFEKSFESTLRTLRSISETSINNGGYRFGHQNRRSSTLELTENKERGFTSNSDVEDCCSEAVARSFSARDQLNTAEEVNESIPREPMNQVLALRRPTNQVASISPFEKAVVEQSRSNDLKTLELGLTMRKMKLKETQLALSYDSNHIERSKLAMGISKATFKAEKFKNQLEDTRHTELHRKCIDCLVAGLFIMSGALSYGAYVHSYRKIIEATASCTPSSTESKSWWIPNQIATLNSGLHIIRCQVQVVSRMLFGMLMILAIAYLLLQRSATSNQTMPVTFILLLLGLACGFAGKLCVDTLGGSGYHWLLYWETLCLLHFFSNICTSALFFILHGPVAVAQRRNCDVLLPHWVRRILFYAVLLVFLPVLCGLMPFAGLYEWKDHFFLMIINYLSDNTGEGS